MKLGLLWRERSIEDWDLETDRRRKERESGGGYFNVSGKETKL